jgi:GT2 family glycosyltransferase
LQAQLPEGAVKTPVDIVIPMYNAAGHIEACLEHVFASNYPHFSVIVVDDGSSDDSLQRASRFPNVKILVNPVNRGGAAARNRGIDEAGGEILVFLDADVLVPPDLVSHMLRTFEENPEAAVVQARYDDRSHYRNLYSQYKHYIFSFRGLEPNREGEKYAHYVHTACVALQRRVVEAVRFDESMRRGEDIDFGQRCVAAGFLILADPALTVGHMKKYTLATFCRYQFRAAMELASQALSKQGRNSEQPFYAEKNPVYKKLWLLRPVLGGLLLLNLLWLALGGSLVAGLSLALVILIPLGLEAGFRLYLWRTAPLAVNLGAFLLYFQDGILVLAGILRGILYHLRTRGADKV